MSTGDPVVVDSPTGQVDTNPRRGRFLARWIPAMVVVAVVAGLAAVLLGSGHGPAGSSPGVGGGSANTAGWQTYHDPLNMYSLRLPPGWTAQVSTGSSTYGDRTGSMSVTTEGVVFSDPQYGDSSARVYIMAEPIASDFSRHWYCQAFSRNQENSTFHGIPAVHFQDAVWLFSSANAHFQLDVWIPGVLEPPHEMGPGPIIQPTPLPSSWIAADRADINGVLASLQPANPAPLSC